MTFNPGEMDDIDKAWGDAQPPDSGFEQAPPGTYQTYVAKVEFRHSKAGQPMLMWQFQIEGGASAGVKVPKFSMLDDPKSLGYLKQDLGRIGVQLGKFSDLKLGELLDMPVEVTVKNTGGELPRVYINRLWDEAGADVEPPTNKFDDDDIPF